MAKRISAPLAECPDCKGKHPCASWPFCGHDHTKPVAQYCWPCVKRRRAEREAAKVASNG